MARPATMTKVVGLLLVTISFAHSTHAQAKPTPEQERIQSEENDKSLLALQSRVQASLPSEMTAPEGTANFLSPQHDIRLTLDFAFLSNEIAKFYGIGYGDTIHIGPPCGDPRFLVEINEVPKLNQKGYLYYNGSFGTNVTLNLVGKAQLYGYCFSQNPSIGAGANLAASVANINNATSISVSGLAYIKGIALLWPFMYYPFHFDIPFEGKPLSRIPIKLEDSETAQFDFGAFQNGQWVSTGKEKDLSLTVNAGGISSTSSQGNFLIADAAIGTKFSTKSFPNAPAAQADFAADLPIWDPSSQKIGLSISRGFFGTASPDKPGTGAFGFLLPIRVQGTLDRRILFFHIRKKYEVFIDGAETTFEPHEGSTAVRVNLSSSRWTITNADSKRATPKSGPIKDVTASILFDRFVLDDELLKFRVADFRLKIRTKWLAFPITLSSGQLQDSLNGGTVPLAGFKNSFSIDLPSCVKTNADILLCQAGKCTDICPRRKECLSFAEGTQSLAFTLDPTIQTQAQGDFLHLALRVTATP